MTIGDRIKRRSKELGISVIAIAKACGISRAAVYAWMSGDSKGLQGKNLVIVASVLKVNERWLETGHGPKEADAMKLIDGETEFLEKLRRLEKAELEHVQNLVDLFLRKKGGDGIG